MIWWVGRSGIMGEEVGWNPNLCSQSSLPHDYPLTPSSHFRSLIHFCTFSKIPMTWGFLNPMTWWVGPSGILGEEVGRNPKTQALTKTAEGVVLRFLSLVSFVAAQQACCVRYLLVAPLSSSATMVLALRFSIPLSSHLVFLTRRTFCIRAWDLKVCRFGVLVCLACCLIRLVSRLVCCLFLGRSVR
jgi:hypothetical protein